MFQSSVKGEGEGGEGGWGGGGGEGQKIALSRALYQDRLVIILDVKWSRETSCAYSACS